MQIGRIGVEGNIPTVTMYTEIELNPLIALCRMRG